MSSGANHSWLTSLTYPDSRVLNYNYSAGLEDRISRLSSLFDNSATLESYDYLGLATVVRRAHPQPSVDLTYIKQAGKANGSAQTRSHNRQNQITSISGQTTPAYDNNGNLTTDQTGKTLVYDAWNRPVHHHPGQLHA